MTIDHSPLTIRHKGIILMNLGSPDSTSVKDVRKYLNEFLMDARVIDKPLLSRALLVRGIIVPFRAAKSAEAYKTIWTEHGSPLVVISKQLQEAVKQQVDIPVTIAMRYGSQSPLDAFEELLKIDPELEEVLLIPMYPHYAMSSYETAVEYAKEIHNKIVNGQLSIGNKDKNSPLTIHHSPPKFKLSFTPAYYNDPNYIDALADTMEPYLAQNYDHILFSYHGIPARHLVKTDPTGCHCMQSADCCETPSPAHATCYRHQVRETTRLVTNRLNLPADKWSISFQSRLGKGWLEPFTDIRLEELPKEGIKKLLILSPAFVSDCLETLEELEERGKESFIGAGGESYQMIPCLNTNPLWVKTIAKWIEDFRKQ